MHVAVADVSGAGFSGWLKSLVRAYPSRDGEPDPTCGDAAWRYQADGSCPISNP
jgi:hypothetical protein